MDQMTRIIRFWSFAIHADSLIAIKEQIPFHKVFKMLFRESVMDSEIVFQVAENDSIAFEDLGTLGYRVYENRSGMARLICDTLRCSILCVNHHLPDSSSMFFSLINGS